MLSGGERNRLLLARLFARPANLLVLDEPTNDLDIESLELLEAALQDYAGTMLLVSTTARSSTTSSRRPSRRRAAVCGANTPAATATGCAQRPAPAPASPAPSERGDRRPSRQPQKVKLTFKEQRDLESLPSEIESLEREQHELTARMAGADYHRAGPEKIRADRQRAEEIERLLERAFERWSALEEKAKLAAAS